MKKTTLLLLSSLLVAQAHAFGFNDVVNWTGSGSNEAAMLIDWQDGSAHSALVWGYRWNGTASGEDMLDAIVAADPRLTDHITSYSFGDAVDELAYNGDGLGPNGPGSHDQNGFNAGTPGFWDYYNGNGATEPAWTESGVGFSARTLSNQDWDGWSWAANFNSATPSGSPIAAPAAAPEPMSLAFLGLGATVFVKRRRR